MLGCTLFSHILILFYNLVNLLQQCVLVVLGCCKRTCSFNKQLLKLEDLSLNLLFFIVNLYQKVIFVRTYTLWFFSLLKKLLVNIFWTASLLFVWLADIRFWAESRKKFWVWLVKSILKKRTNWVPLWFNRTLQ